MSKIQRLLAFISPMLVAGFAYEPVRRYTFMVLAALGALYALALSLAALPGRVGRVALGVATDLEAIRGAIPKPPAEPEKPKAPPTIPPLAGMMLGAFLFALLLPGCPPSARAPQARQDARAVVTLVAYGVQRANAECAVRGRALAETDQARGIAVLEKCQAATVEARAWLEAAEGTLDTWDAGKAGEWACFLRGSLRSTRSLAEALGGLGLQLAALEDAITGAASVASFAVTSCSTTTTTPAADAGTGG